jgi:tetratricopeptide (TPR) repeat protein
MYKPIVSIVFGCFISLTVSAQNNGYFADSIKKIEFFNNIESYAEALHTALLSEKLLSDSSALNIQYFTVCGQASNGLGKDSLALRYFNKALLLDSLSVSVKKEIAIIEYRLGNIEKSVNLFQQILTENELAASERSWLAKIYTEQDDISSALTVLQSRPALHKNHFKLMHLEAKLLIMNKYFSSGLEIYAQLVERKPDDLDLKDEYIKALFKSSRWQEVIDMAQELYLKNPTSELAFIIGSSYEYLNNSERALQWFQSAAANCIDPSIDVYYSYAGLSAERLLDYKTAIQMYQKAIRYNPQNGYHQFFLAKCYDITGQTTQAQKYFERFLKSEQAKENKEFTAFAKQQLEQYKVVKFMTVDKDSL